MVEMPVIDLILYAFWAVLHIAMAFWVGVLFAARRLGAGRRACGAKAPGGVDG